jgi:hypothetical protein
MSSPTVLPRIKEWLNSFSEWISGSGEIVMAFIATMTSQRQIIGIVRAT